MELHNVTYRPGRLDKYVCDPAVKLRISEMLAASRKRGVLPAHMLITGGPGTGKSTLANIMAGELRVPVIKFLGRELKSVQQLTTLYKVPEYGAILFLDEAHAIPTSIAELLYPIMEDRQMSAAGDPSLTIHLNPLMVIGATTEPGSLAKPLLDRFVTKIHIPAYTSAQMCEIVAHMADKTVRIPVTEDAVVAIAGRAKSTPRIAGALLHQVHDSAVANDKTVIDGEFVEKFMSSMQVTSEGLDAVDMGILKALKEHGTVGAETLSLLVGIDQDSLSTTYEPYLMRQGYVVRTRHGRTLSSKGAILAQKYGI